MNARVHTDITEEPLALEPVYAFLSDQAAGAVVVFAGVVRNHSEGRSVAGLTYEAFTEKALGGLEELAGEICDAWPSVRALWMTHRTGALAVGEPSVIVGVSSDHRPAAFEAARHGIDTLKATVPIWKHEHWSDGSSHWPGTD